MSAVQSETLLNDLCVSGLIRLQRAELGPLLVSAPRLSIEDVSSLRLQWALSDAVRNLTLHLIEHPRSVGTVLSDDEVQSSGLISGALDARASVTLQAITGDGAVFVTREPIVTVISGANQLVGWVLREADQAIMQSNRTVLNAEVDYRTKLVEKALRNGLLRDVLNSPASRTRPGLASLRAASKSRAKLYRLALSAFKLLDGVLNLEAEALGQLFKETLIPVLERWQKFELATAIGVARALANAFKESPHLRLMHGVGKPFVSVGSLDVYWQRRLPERDELHMDPSELVAKEIAEYIGPGLSFSRADITLVHGPSGEVVSIIECKWFESIKSLPSAVADAAGQISRYARDARAYDITSASELIKQSWIVVAARGDHAARTGVDGIIRFTDLEGISLGDFQGWANAMAQKYAHGSAATGGESSGASN